MKVVNIQYNAAGLQVHVRWCVLQALRELNWIWWSGEVGTLHSEGDASSLAEAELWAGPGCTVGIQPFAAKSVSTGSQ